MLNWLVQVRWAPLTFPPSWATPRRRPAQPSWASAGAHPSWGLEDPIQPGEMETNSSTVNFGKVSLQNVENCSFAMKQIIYIESLLNVFFSKGATTLKFRILSINTWNHDILPNCKTPMHGPTNNHRFWSCCHPSTGTHPSPTNLQHQSASTNIPTHNNFPPTKEPQTLLPNPTYLEEAIFPLLLIDPLISI